MAPKGALPAEPPMPHPLRLGAHSQAHLEAFQVVDVDGPVAADGCQPVPIRARCQQVNGLGAACRDPWAERGAGSPKLPRDTQPHVPRLSSARPSGHKHPQERLTCPSGQERGTPPPAPTGEEDAEPRNPQHHPSSPQPTPEGGRSVCRCLQPPGSSSWRTWTDPRAEATKRLSESAENWSW